MSLPQEMDLPDDWDTLDQQQKQQYFLKLQKGKQVQSKKNAPRNVLPQTPQKSQMLKEKIGVMSTEALLKSDHKFLSSKMFMTPMTNTRGKELKVKHWKILMKYLNQMTLKYGKFYLLM